MGSVPVMHPDRDEAWVSIRDSMSDAMAYDSNDSIVMSGDSLELLRRMPDDSVSLILTDPPYHSTRKSNIMNDTAFREDGEFIEWMESYAVEWERVLRANGTLYMFCSSCMSAGLEVMISRYFRPLSHIIWTKPNLPGFDGWRRKASKDRLRAWYPHSERILVFEHGEPGMTHRSPFGEYLQETRKICGISMKELTEKIGEYGTVNHGGAVANWETGRNIPSENQYDRIREALIGTGGITEMPSYHDVIRPMDLHDDMEYTDVWDFPSVKPHKGKHPAEKPIPMLEHIIHASSYPDDIILDCFAGSGTTGIAARNLGRRSILMELDPQWVTTITSRMA